VNQAGGGALPGRAAEAALEQDVFGGEVAEELSQRSGIEADLDAGAARPVRSAADQGAAMTAQTFNQARENVPPNRRIEPGVIDRRNEILKVL